MNRRIDPVASMMGRTRAALSVAIAIAAIAGPGAAMAADATRGWQVATQECGPCHQVATSPAGVATGHNSLDQLAQKAIWPQIPMRSWLSVVHQPRIPAVSRNEADLNALQAYIDVLRQTGVPPDDLTVVGEGPKGPKIEPEDGDDPLDVQRRQPKVQFELPDMPVPSGPLNRPTR